MKNILRAIVLLFFLAAAGAAVYGKHWFDSALSALDSAAITVQKDEFQVRAGDTAKSLAGRLTGKEFNQYVLSYWLKQHPDVQNIKVGIYSLEDCSTLADALRLFVTGKAKVFRVTLVEGRTLDDYLKVLAGEKRLKHDLAGLSYSEVSGRLGLGHENPEGLFLPDTFNYEADDTESAILKRSHDALRKFLDEEWLKRADGLPFKNQYEALILASIVEKETSAESERPLVASVFLNRLRLHMKLQTDPTVIYGVRDRYTGKITKSDLADANPYNTYVIDGLPPTPIAAPSKGSIEAVLHPAESDYLYFVASGKGGHVFSKTIAEHARAVAEYRRFLKSQDNAPAATVEDGAAPADDQAQKQH